MYKLCRQKLSNRLFFTCIDQSKNIDEAVVSFRGFQYSDKETNQIINGCLQNETFSGVIQKKLVEKCEKNLPNIDNPNATRELVKKFLYPNTITVWTLPNLVEYWQYPIIARFIYTLLHPNHKKAFLKDAVFRADIKTMQYCFGHGGDVNDVYVDQRRECDEWTALSLGIGREDIDLVRIVLAHGANPDQCVSGDRKAQLDLDMDGRSASA